MNAKTNKMKVDKIEIEGVTYVPEGDEMASKVDGLDLVMIRTYSAGVHYGYLAKRESTLAGIEVTLRQARRVHRWSGAASLSQLAMEGTSKPDSCRIPCAVNEIELVAIEVIPMTSEAQESLSKVPLWTR